MAMPARAVGDKTFKAGGSGFCSLFFQGAHYEKSLEATAPTTCSISPTILDTQCAVYDGRQGSADDWNAQEARARIQR